MEVIMKKTTLLLIAIACISSFLNRDIEARPRYSSDLRGRTTTVCRNGLCRPRPDNPINYRGYPRYRHYGPHRVVRGVLPTRHHGYYRHYGR